MDPFVVVEHDKELYRTRVIRHDLNPSFNDKFLLNVQRSAAPLTAPPTHYTASLPDSNSTFVKLAVLDWEQFSSKNRHIGSATLDLKSVFEDAPKPDEDTGLYSAEAMRLQKFQEFKVNLGLGSENLEKWDKGVAPSIIVR